MLEASPNIGAGTITVSDDPRVLPFGKFLRATKINEIPQLINVILGEMTLIGPRPLTSREFNIYSLQGQQIISSVLPGLSGLGSVALRNETRFLHIENDPHQSYASFIVPYREKLEIWFVENRSVLLYQKLIIATILVVIFPNLNILNKLNLQIPFLEESNSEQD
jgi:lipopolysaccharide/colanic/teichoic acid biosynthesis glycosyltransferase